MSRAKPILLAVLIGLLLILILQNTEVVAVRLLFWELQMSRVLLLMLSAAAGFGAGFLVSRMNRR